MAERRRAHLEARDTPRSDNVAIRAAHARSHAALAAHDLAGITRVMRDDYVSVSSTNARNLDRDAARGSYEQIFSTRPGVVFVRTPTTVTVNAQWRQAAEHGRWTGRWTAVDGRWTAVDGEVRVGGTYFAKWVETAGEWKLLSETFVQTECTGKSFCEKAP